MNYAVKTFKRVPCPENNEGLSWDKLQHFRHYLSPSELGTILCDGCFIHLTQDRNGGTTGNLPKVPKAIR